jgi:hypothetical protein
VGDGKLIGVRVHPIAISDVECGDVTPLSFVFCFDVRCGVRRCNAALFGFSVSDLVLHWRPPDDSPTSKTKKQKKAALHRRTPN